MAMLGEINFDQFINQPILNIFDETPTFHKFIYQSQRDSRTLLKNSILLNTGPSNDVVYIVCDLYRQTSPPMLSPHMLVRRHSDANDLFVIDKMVQFEPDNPMRKYVLENFHILSVPPKKKEESLIAKLHYLQQWATGSEQITEEQMKAFRNKVTYESFESKSDDKVYLGFTAYIHDHVANCKVKFAGTEFSSAIYDCNNSVTLHPFVSSRAGGSLHVLTVETFASANIQIQLCDDSGWSALATNVMRLEDRIQFSVPPYSGTWHDDDETRLVYIKVLVNHQVACKKPIKFLYTR